MTLLLFLAYLITPSSVSCLVDDPYYCGFSARVPAFASAPVQPATPKLEKNKGRENYHMKIPFNQQADPV